MEIYRVLTSFFSFVVSVFYSEIDVRGEDNIPEEGPVIFCGFHPNGLIDPVLIMCLTDRIVSPIAKSTLFDIPGISFVLRGLKAVAVKRRQDFVEGAQVDNSPAITAMAEILKRGDCIVIFPEGVSHDDSEVHELKSGFARAAMMALGDKSKNTHKVSVIPVGMNYMDKGSFRSKVFVEFGAALEITREQIPKNEAEQHEFVKNLTRHLHQALSEVTLTAPSWDILRALFLARDLFFPEFTILKPDEFIELTHRFVNGYKKAQHEKEVVDTVEELHDYQTQLDILRLTDAQVSALVSGSKWKLFRHSMSVFFFYAITLPFTLPGVIVHAPIGIIARLIGLKLSKSGTPSQYDKDQIAHFKIMSTIILLPIVYSVVGYLISEYLGKVWVIPLLTAIFLSGFLAINIRPITFTFKALVLAIKYLLVDFSAIQAKRQRLQHQVREIIQKYKGKYEPQQQQQQQQSESSNLRHRK